MSGSNCGGKWSNRGKWVLLEKRERPKTANTVDMSEGVDV